MKKSDKLKLKKKVLEGRIKEQQAIDKKNVIIKLNSSFNEKEITYYNELLYHASDGVLCADYDYNEREIKLFILNANSDLLTNEEYMRYFEMFKPLKYRVLKNKYEKR